MVWSNKGIDGTSPFCVLEARNRFFIPGWCSASDQLSISERREKTVFKLYKAKHLPQEGVVYIYSSAANSHFTTEKNRAFIPHLPAQY